MTREEFLSFQHALTELCRTYGILIHSNNERRDNLNLNAVYFYEIGLRAKIEPRETMVMEARKKFQ